ncbi:uncharacterized protein HaLaN_12970, partial [Haematococcus lacustris]
MSCYTNICRHLHVAAGWCIFAELCPREVAALEDCLGVPNMRHVGPGCIPSKCRLREEQLAICLEVQQEGAQARTAACPGKAAREAAAAAAAPAPAHSTASGSMQPGPAQAAQAAAAG